LSAWRIALRGKGGLETPAAIPHLKPMARRIVILNGPNLNLLGRREPAVYGRATLGDIETACREEASRLGMEVECWQSNSEGELVTWIQEIPGRFAGVVLNAGAYSHTSIALLDALRALDEPLIEVHLSNIYRRETFRQHSYVSLAATGVICGFGPEGYVMALRALAAMWDDAQ
jgi:3-dehydroquinate dehydratase-2